jgi:hypothetical protein
LFFAWLAELCAKGGRIEEGLAALEQGRAMSEETEDRFSLPEFDRIEGELLLVRSARNPADAQACFERSMQLARARDAKCLELRAATRLARLWGEQGRCTEAHELLEPIYDWFTEGLDTADLKDARALLDGDLIGFIDLETRSFQVLPSLASARSDSRGRKPQCGSAGQPGLRVRKSACSRIVRSPVARGCDLLVPEHRAPAVDRVLAWVGLWDRSAKYRLN